MKLKLQCMSQKTRQFMLYSLRSSAFIFGMAIGICTLWVQDSIGARHQIDLLQGTPQDGWPLEPGKPVMNQLIDGQEDAYRITLATGDYLEIYLDRYNLEKLKVILLDPDRREIFQHVNNYWERGQIAVIHIANVPGSYRLVISGESSSKRIGRYVIQATSLRKATDSDRALCEVVKLHASARSQYKSGQHKSSLQALEQAITLYEKELLPDSKYLGYMLADLGIFYADQGELNKARQAYDRAKAVLEKFLGIGHIDIGLLYYRIGHIHRRTGSPDQAEEFFRRSLAILEKEATPDHEYIIMGLNGLAISYFDRSDFKKAEQLFLQVIALDEKVYGVGHPHTTAYLSNLGSLFSEMGEYSKAVEIYQQVLSLEEKTYGIGAPLLSPRLSNLGRVYALKGDFTKAEKYIQDAIASREKQYGPSHLELAPDLNNLAYVYLERGDFARAESLILRALTIYENALGPWHARVAISVQSLASVYRLQGAFAKAEELARRSLSIREKSLGLDHYYTSFSLIELANILRDKGSFDEAEQLYARAIDVASKSLGMKHPKIAELFYEYSAACEARGDVKRSVELLSRAWEISEHHLDLNINSGSERQKLAYLGTLTQETNRAVSLHVRTSPSSSQARTLALTMILQRKGRALDTISESFGNLRRRLDAQDQAKLDQLNDINARLARLVLAGPQKNPLNDHQEKIRHLEDQKEILEAEISTRSTEFRAQTQPVTIEAIQSAIPADTVLIEYFSYRPYSVKYVKATDAFLEPHYVAYVLRHQGEAMWVELGEAKVIDKAVDGFRQSLRDPNRFDVRQQAQRLDQLVMRPLRPLLGNTRQVLISPDGALNLVPFAALVDEENLYLVDQYSFRYMTSGRDLLRLGVGQVNRSENVVLADPAYGQATADEKMLATSRDIVKKADGGLVATSQLSQSISMEQLLFRPLPGTAGEAEALKRLFPKAIVLTKEQATEAALKKTRRPRILHVATHGFFLRDLDLPNPNAGTSELARLPELTANGEKIENPLLRSGLALAGANLRRSGEEDGILTALEASGLDLWGTKLVVLSACDTGVGEVKNGEGVYGLRRALVLAGSETQVMSLWPVSDMATRDLMVDYYGRLQRGDGRGEALRQAQLRMLRDPRRRHPYYWASFIQSGEWANLDGEREQRRPAPLGGKAKSGGH